MLLFIFYFYLFFIYFSFHLFIYFQLNASCIKLNLNIITSVVKVSRKRMSNEWKSRREYIKRRSEFSVHLTFSIGSTVRGKRIRRDDLTTPSHRDCNVSIEYEHIEWLAVNKMCHLIGLPITSPGAHKTKFVTDRPSTRIASASVTWPPLFGAHWPFTCSLSLQLSITFIWREKPELSAFCMQMSWIYQHLSISRSFPYFLKFWILNLSIGSLVEVTRRLFAKLRSGQRRYWVEFQPKADNPAAIQSSSAPE